MTIINRTRVSGSSGAVATATTTGFTSVTAGTSPELTITSTSGLSFTSMCMYCNPSTDAVFGTWSGFTALSEMYFRVVLNSTAISTGSKRYLVAYSGGVQVFAIALTANTAHLQLRNSANSAVTQSPTSSLNQLYSIEGHAVLTGSTWTVELKAFTDAGETSSFWTLAPSTVSTSGGTIDSVSVGQIDATGVSTYIYDAAIGDASGGWLGPATPQVTYAVGTASTGTSGTATASFDHTPVAGEQLALLVGAYSSGQTTAPSFTTPSGWSTGPAPSFATTIGITKRAATAAQFRLTASGGDTAPSVTVGNSAAGWVAVLVQISGLDTTTPVESDGTGSLTTAANSASGSVTLGSVTPTQATDFVLSVGAIYAAQTPSPSWTGTTALTSGEQGSAPGLALAIGGTTGGTSAVAPTLNWTAPSSQRGFINGGFSTVFKALTSHSTSASATSTVTASGSPAGSRGQHGAATAVTTVSGSPAATQARTAAATAATTASASTAPRHVATTSVTSTTVTSGTPSPLRDATAAALADTVVSATSSGHVTRAAAVTAGVVASGSASGNTQRRAAVIADTTVSAAASSHATRPVTTTSTTVASATASTSSAHTAAATATTTASGSAVGQGQHRPAVTATTIASAAPSGHAQHPASTTAVTAASGTANPSGGGQVSATATTIAAGSASPIGHHIGAATAVTVAAASTRGTRQTQAAATGVTTASGTADGIPGRPETAQGLTTASASASGHDQHPTSATASTVASGAVAPTTQFRPSSLATVTATAEADALARLTASAVAQTIVSGIATPQGFAPFRDVAFTATLEPDRWNTVLDPDRWAAGLDPDRWAVTLDHDRWTATLDQDRYTIILEADVPRTIRASLGDRAYVSVKVTETSGADITTDSFLISLGTYTDPGDPETPDVVEQVSAGVARVKLLVGASPGLDYPVGDYWAWTRAIDAPEQEWLRADDKVTIA